MCRHCLVSTLKLPFNQCWMSSRTLINVVSPPSHPSFRWVIYDLKRLADSWISFSFALSHSVAGVVMLATLAYVMTRPRLESLKACFNTSNRIRYCESMSMCKLTQGRCCVDCHLGVTSPRVQHANKHQLGYRDNYYMQSSFVF